MMERRTVMQEAARQAKLVDVPVGALCAYIEKDLLAHPIKLTYEIIPGTLDIALVCRYEEQHAVRVKLNLNHPFVLKFMMDDRVCSQSQRQALEAMLMILFGVGEEMTDERFQFYRSMWQEVGKRLGIAIEIMFAFDRDGFNLLGLSEDAEEEAD